MSEKSKTDQYVEHINSHILPFIDYYELQASYGTDMVYAKGILNRLHEAMVSAYGSERLDEMDGDDGFVIIPGVVRGSQSGNVCLALLELDLSSSGEHWGTSYLCKYGVIAQDGIEKVSNNDSVLKAEIKEINAAYLPYDYGYTAMIPGDIHVDNFRLPETIKSVLNDFRNHRAELQFEDELLQHEKTVEADSIQDVTDVRITAQEFEIKMRELLPGASEKAIKQTILLAEELDADGIYPKGAFFSEQYVCFNMAAKQYGIDVTCEVLKICEESCFSYWEILDAAKLVSENVPPDEIIRRAADRELYLDEKQGEEMKAGLAALKNGTLEVPAADAKGSVLQKIRDAAKTPKEPQKCKTSKKKNEPEL